MTTIDTALRFGAAVRACALYAIPVIYATLRNVARVALAPHDARRGVYDLREKVRASNDISITHDVPPIRLTVVLKLRGG